MPFWRAVRQIHTSAEIQHEHLVLLYKFSNIAAVCVDVLCRGISDTSRHLWSERGADDEEHCAEWKTWHVWLLSDCGAATQLSAWRKPSYSSLPKVTRFHRTTICQTFPRVGTRKDLSTFIWVGLNSLAKLWSCYFTVIACFKQWSRWRKGNICSTR